MKFKFVLFLCLLVFSFSFLSPSQSQADPSKEVEDLMGQSMSMFDFGLYYLELQIKGIIKVLNGSDNYEKIGIGQPSVYYDFLKNEIVIWIELSKAPIWRFEDVETGRKSIEQIIESLNMATTFSMDTYFKGFFKRGYSAIGKDVDVESLAAITKFSFSARCLKDGQKVNVVCTTNWDGSGKMCSE